jgi:hypothetical protein
MRMLCSGWWKTRPQQLYVRPTAIVNSDYVPLGFSMFFSLALLCSTLFYSLPLSCSALIYSLPLL